MNDFGLRPSPPRWALEAGLDAPKEGEGFTEYVTRLGLNASELLIDLHEQTAPLANGRLAHTLSQAMPGCRDRFIDSLAKRHIDPSRREELDNAARSLFADRYRRRRPSTA